MLDPICETLCKMLQEKCFKFKNKTSDTEKRDKKVDLEKILFSVPSQL